MHISETEITVRYAETDQMGVVYHANYLVWMEIGRTNLIQDLGFSYAQLEKDDILAPVTNANVSYKKPLRYGEKAKIRTWIEKYDGLRTTYGYEIITETEEVAATGFTEHVTVRRKSFRPLSLRKAHPEWHKTYEKMKKQARV